MTKKERVISAIKGLEPDFVPSFFILHYEDSVSRGDLGVKSHIDFYDQTKTDILKVMNENLVPDVGEILTPEDWNKIPSYTLEDDFMQLQIEMATKVRSKCSKDDFLLGTIHSICASAIHPIEWRYGYENVRELLCRHLRENKEPVLAAMQRITDGMCLLIQKFMEIGLDGVFVACLGGEKRYFTDSEFEEYIKPFDLQILKTVKDSGGYAFLHICKDKLEMNRYHDYVPYADVVNWGVYQTDFSLENGRKMFPNSAIMGGLENRSGVLVDGSVEELVDEVKRIVDDFGKKGFILGADCSIATETPYDRIRAITDKLKTL